MNSKCYGYFFWPTNLFRRIPKTIIIKHPVSTGENRYSKDTDPNMTIMGFPPAGGWVTSNNIINPTPKPTAKGIRI